MFDVDSLKTSGRALWDGVKKAKKVGMEHEALLFNAARIADRLDDLSLELMAAPLIEENSKGDRIANPLLTEHRQQLLAMKAILAGLGVGALVDNKAGKKTIADAIAEQRALREAAK